jgi:hypothetical protein
LLTRGHIRQGILSPAQAAETQRSGGENEAVYPGTTEACAGKAIAYSLGQWEKLERYLENGHLQIDNNRAERAIKPFVIGQKELVVRQYC